MNSPIISPIEIKTPIICKYDSKLGGKPCDFVDNPCVCWSTKLHLDRIKELIKIGYDGLITRVNYKRKKFDKLIQKLENEYI